jgi:uncharacterized protein YfaP (DUF2135 family)
MLVLALGAGLAGADEVNVQILSAVVKDQRISGATVTLQKNGAKSAVATTDGQGVAKAGTEFADGGDSLIIVKKAGYSNLVAKCPCKGMTYAMSPVMTNLDGLRIVLNWGSDPPDLDSHIAFPGNHIFWNSKVGTDANLDVDDTNGYGPETITISRRHAGESYVYAVHDFTDSTAPTSNHLARSRAKVLVYVGQSLVRSYYVPNQPGNLWTVFRITADGEFQDINTMRGTTLGADAVLGSIDNYLNASTRVDAPSVSAADVDSADALNRAGEQAYHGGDLDQAIDLYRQAIDVDPNFGQAYSNLGLAHAKAGHTAEAIWANRKAIALAGGSTAATVRASSHYNIAKIYEAAGQYVDALAEYQAAKREKANPVYDRAIERVGKLAK